MSVCTSYQKSWRNGLGVERNGGKKEKKKNAWRKKGIWEPSSIPGQVFHSFFYGVHMYGGMLGQKAEKKNSKSDHIGMPTSVRCWSCLHSWIPIILEAHAVPSWPAAAAQTPHGEPQKKQQQQQPENGSENQPV